MLLLVVVLVVMAVMMLSVAMLFYFGPFDSAYRVTHLLLVDYALLFSMCECSKHWHHTDTHIHVYGNIRSHTYQQAPKNTYDINNVHPVQWLEPRANKNNQFIWICFRVFVEVSNNVCPFIACARACVCMCIYVCVCERCTVSKMGFHTDKHLNFSLFYGAFFLAHFCSVFIELDFCCCCCWICFQC